MGMIGGIVGVEEKPTANAVINNAVTGKIEEAVTTIRLEAEHRELGVGTILISAERLRQIMRLVFLNEGEIGGASRQL